MAKNKIADIAKLFGKELYEDFTINFYGRLYDVTFNEDGLKVFSDTLFEDELSRLLLEGLILGNAVIIGDGTKKY